MAVRRVFFDVGGTMLLVEGSVGAVYSGVARRHGVKVDPVWLDARFRVAWKASALRSRERGHRCSDGQLESEWQRIVAETFGDRVAPDTLPSLFRDLYEHFIGRAAWRVAPGLVSTLDALRSRGLPLGVLSNWDRRLEATLAAFELIEPFDVCVVSHLVGVEKPHPAIFEEAESRSKCRGSEILLVGDSPDADIEPARARGWRTLRLDRTGGDRVVAGRRTIESPLRLRPSASSLRAEDSEYAWSATGFDSLTEDDWTRILGLEAAKEPDRAAKAEARRAAKPKDGTA